jgi:putative membrane protein insertion efficiency factor
MGRALAVRVVRLYQRLISRHLPGVCVMQPSCSEYTLLAIEKRGLARGGWAGLRRVWCCRPARAGSVDYP